MSIRFESANSESANRTSDLINFNSSYTIMGWIYLSSDKDDFATFFNLKNADGNADNAGVTPDGTTLELYCEGGSGAVRDTGTNLSTFTWYHVALVRSGTTVSIYLNGNSTPDCQVTHTPSTRVATSGMYLASYFGSTDYLNGRIAYARAWSVALTTAEIATEKDSTTAVKTENLYADWRTPDGSERLNDFSGNTRHWSTGSTLSDEANPAIGAYTVSVSDTVGTSETKTVTAYLTAGIS